MKKTILPLIALVLAASMVFAFGVSSPYWEGNDLEIAPGETMIVDLNLQNMVGDEDVTVKVEIIEGSDIVSLTKDTYVILAQTSDTMAPLKISMPKSTAIGEINSIKVEVKTVASDDGGGVAMGTAMITEFNAVTIEKPSEGMSTTNIILIVVGIILLIIIITVLLRKKK